MDAILLKSIDVGLPITHLAAHSAIKTSVFVAARKPKANPNAQKPDPFTHIGKANSIIYSVSLAVLGSKTTASTITGGVFSRKPRDLLRLGKTRDASGLQVSPDGKWLLAIGNRKVQIAKLSSLRDGFTKFVSDERLVSLAFHPTEPTFATGDATGKIRIWHCLDDSYIAQSKEAGGEKRAPSTLLHWHAHAVTSLAFTPNGAHLLSGGEEAVLVLWQLASRAKEFVPRLGAPISSIAVADGMDGREQEFVLALADGSVTFIGALNLKPTRTFARVKVDPSRQLLPYSRLSTLPAPLAIEPVTGQIVLGGSHPSSLQFFDTLDDTVVSELEVAPSNRTSRPDEAPLEPTRIDKVVFSPQRAAGHSNGPAEWMATIDSRHGGSLSSELALKFWRYSSSAGRYVLNTRIDNPHDDGVTSIAFSPLSPSDDSDALLFVSTGLDKKIKTWKIASHTARGGRLETYWVARSVFGYRETVPAQAAWSPDGSLLAVSQGAFVTLWEPVSNSLIMALSCPELKTSTLLSFAGQAARYIVVGNSKTIVCWDLVTSSVKWHKVYNETVDKIVSLPDRNSLAILRKTPAFGGGPRGSNASRSKPTTLIDEVDPSSAETLKTYSVPYGIREALAVRTAAAVAAITTSTPPRLVAISDSFDAFEIGTSAADVAAALESSTTATATNEASTSRVGDTAQSLRALGVKRRTLFDDLFGSVERERHIDELLPPTTTQLQQSRKPNKNLFTIFDTPAHLLPPVQSIFDDVLKTILPPARPVGDDDDDQSTQLQQQQQVTDIDQEDGDVDMQLDEEAETDASASAGAASRLVRKNTSTVTRAQEDEKTIDVLAHLFRTQLVGRQGQSQAQIHTQAAAPASAATPVTKAKRTTANGTTSTSTPQSRSTKPNGTSSSGRKSSSGGGGGAGSPKAAKTTTTTSTPPAKAGTKRSSMS